MTRSIVVLFAIVALGERSVAQIRCTALVDRNVYEIGETFTLSIEISGSDVNVSGYPKLPAMEGLESLYANAGESTSISIINGRQSVTKSYQFLLKAAAVGKWTVPPVEVEVSGNTFKTQALTIEVVPAGSRKNPDASEQEIFLALVPTKTEVFVGQETQVALKIYTRVNVTQYSPKKLPAFVGFWAQDFELPKTLEPESETVNGIAYRSYTIKRTALFPARPGRLTIDPAEIECELRISRRSRNPFDDFMSPFSDPFGRVVTMRLLSKPVTITVNELPDEGRPAQFSGLVGSFDVTSRVDKNETKTGEAVVYKLTVSGVGNLMSMSVPATPFSDDFEKYDPKVDQQIKTSGDVIRGSKTFEFVAVPRAPRQFQIPAYTFSYFDPSVRKYVTKQSSAHSLSIKPGAAATYTGGSLSKEEVALLSRDIRFIKTGRPSWEESYFFWWMIGLYALPAAALAGVMLYKRRETRRGENPDIFRYRKASPMARSGLKKAARLMKDNHLDNFYFEMSKTLTGFINDKLGSSDRVLLSDDVRSRLRERGVSEEHIDDYLRCINVCDEARFSPDGKDRHRMEKVYEQVREAILTLDKVV